MPGEVLVSGSSCLGPCEQGPTVVVYPEGTWYSKVTEADVATILDEHIKGGKPVAKLNLTPSGNSAQSILLFF